MRIIWQTHRLCIFLLLLATENVFGRPQLFSWLSRRSSWKEVSSVDKEKPILLLDVDNTLYSEILYGIENQIIHGIHGFCRDHLNLTVEQAQELHVVHGSTIQGLMATRHVSRRQIELFYKEVYKHVDMRSLLATNPQSSGGDESVTGYSHSAGENSLVRDLLAATSMASEIALYIASNSPRYHIEKVIHALGMTKVSFQKVITPDSRPKLYPTKATPTLFFDTLLLRQRHDQSQHLHLLDDSAANIRAAQDYMQTHVVHHGDSGDSLVVALCRALGCLPTINYTFSQVEYLRAKNKVDLASLNRETYQQMIQQVIAKMVTARNDNNTLVIADVGAGLLSMLRLMLQGHGDDLPPLFSFLPNTTSRVHYYAYEPNRALEPSCVAVLKDLGFVLGETETRQDDKELVFVRRSNQNEHGAGHPSIVVHLRFWDFDKDEESTQPLASLVVGCCFADLLDPDRLVRSLLRRFYKHDADEEERMLVYLPITFQGTTQFLPGQPYERMDSSSSPVPSDTRAFACYSKALANRHGHNLDPDRLIGSMRQYGGELLRRGSSDWIIDPDKNTCLWEAMMYFFGTVACPELACDGWNARAWIQRARTNRPIIYVSNTDLLMSLPPIGSWKLSEKKHETVPSLLTSYAQIEFTGPNVVTLVEKKQSSLQADQIRIDAIYSLISSGTELKVFTGNFEDAALDVNIKDKETERMAYPLPYGYCLVGKVVECGTNVQDADTLVGKLVFAFSSHASQVVTKRDAIQLVPDGIEPIDAIFMPSIETALSLVHDANPRIGERVVVFGQGLIGLLVTAIMAKSMTSTETSLLAGTLTTVDTLPARLAASAMMGSQEVLSPAEVMLSGPFDIALEVSGNPRALQAAIDATRDGGRVVIGSWYGSSDIALKLGIDFHRSKKTLMASQVSTIPATMTSTWDKDRRFELTWELVRLLCPSRLLTRVMRLEDAQLAYESLRDGLDLAVAFDYRTQD